MESILELKPILLRMFNEVETLQTNLKERDEKIRHLENTIEKLTKENEIYHKVVRMYEGITDDNQPIEQGQGQSIPEEEAEIPIPLRPEAPNVQQSVEPLKQAEEKEVTLKQPRRKIRIESQQQPPPQPQPQPIADKAERMREYQRQYRQKRKDARK